MKKMKQLTLLLLAVAALSSTACDEKTETDSRTESPLVEIDLAAGFYQEAQPASDTQSEGQTRTTYTHDGSGFVVKWKGSDDYPADYDHIGVVVVKSGTTVPYDDSSLRHIDFYPTVSSNTTPLLPQSGETLSLPAGTYNFYAYYPYKSFQTSFLQSEFTLWIDSGAYVKQKQLAPDDNTHLSSLNLLVGKLENHQISDTGNRQELRFDFSHKYSSLELNISNGRNEEVAINKIALHGYDNHRWITPIEYVLNNNFACGVKDSITLSITNPAVLPKSKSQKFWLCIVPNQEFLQKCVIDIHTDKGTYRTEKAFPVNRFKSVANYTTTLTIPQTPATGESWTPVVQ